MSFSAKRLWEAFCNLLTALIYISFVWRFSHSFMQTREASVFLFMIFDTVVVVLLLSRGMPKATSANPLYWIAAMAGTWVSMFTDPESYLPSMRLFVIPQILGIFIAFAGLLSLNRSFGLMAANRGIRTGGIYRHIRHPLYAGYILTTFCFTAQHPVLRNVCVALALLAMEIWRIFIEEKFLSADPAYATYMQATKWRLVPGVW
jgi:protein-S-isoprenylcysteine O-methyltransferase Ste14